MKYIDADKLKAEIERQQRRLILLSNTEQVDMRRDCALQNGVYNNILGIITYLQQEQPEVDLEKEIERYFEKWSDDSEYGQAVMRNGACAGVDECKDIARHFAQWGAEHASGSSEIPNDLKEAAAKEYPCDKSWMTDSMLDLNAHNQVAFWKGAKWHKEQMMKEAVEGIVENWSPEPHPEITIPLNPEEYSNGDKVRVIIVKED